LTSEGLGPLAELGWNDHFAGCLARVSDSSLSPARVAADYGSDFLVHLGTVTSRAGLARSLRRAGSRAAVGDWVGLRTSGDRLEVAAVLERQSAISRKLPDVEASEQVLAANVDLVLIAMALDGDFNPRRLERLLTVAYQSGAAPAIVLTKADLADSDAAMAECRLLAPAVPVLPVSAPRAEGLDGVRQAIGPGRTAVLIGSSGVGKSTLMNSLVGSARLRTGEVHRSGQGRHVTTRRELFTLPAGGVLIDTPGLREIQIWAGEPALEQAFEDVEQTVLRCRFSDCSHEAEPECAVAAALADGSLAASRWESYRKLERELHSIEVRASARLRTEERRRWKIVQEEASTRTAAKRGGPYL
jgi:ribosome biogenesis GTPase / thiamine phosphate phosphatase